MAGLVGCIGGILVMDEDSSGSINTELLEQLHTK
jgi:hypothetical protein